MNQTNKAESNEYEKTFPPINAMKVNICSGKFPKAYLGLAEGILWFLLKVQQSAYW